MNRPDATWPTQGRRYAPPDWSAPGMLLNPPRGGQGRQVTP